MRGLAVALGFLTRWPVPRTGGTLAEALPWFPVAGLAVGVPVALAGRAGAQVEPWMGALAALLAWVLVTGALHLDGLGDTADALGAAHRDRERLLAVMADPHAGSFAVTAIGLQLLAKLVLLHAAGAGSAVALVPVAARIGPLWWARLPALRPGLGAAIGQGRARDLIGWSAILAGACVVVPALLATPLLVLAFAGWARARLGGVTGDVHGAGIELVETGLLLTLAAVR